MPKSFRPQLVLGLLLLAMLAQGIGGIRQLSATFDETAHLPSGYTYWDTGTFRLNPQHPPLIKLWAALPLLLLQPQVDYSDGAWSGPRPNEWQWGYRFLYSQDADQLLFWGRLPIVLLSLLMAFYVYRWSADLYGPWPGVFGAFLCAFSPTVLGHATFVTFDVGLACFATMGSYHLWRYLRHGTERDVWLAGVGLGLTLGSKFSGVVWVGCFAVLLIGAAVTQRSAVGSRKLALAALKIVVVAVVIVQACYFFTDPLAYLRGLQAVNQDRDPSYPYYLMGQFKPGGWWYYFIVAFFVKTPLPTLILLGLASVGWWAHPTDDGLDRACLLLPIVAVFAVTSAFADNLGLRYVLPIYPLMFVWISRLARPLFDRRWGRALGGLLLVWYAGASLMAYPDHLAYFNAAVGGSSNGHRWLDDSNIDWSQDLKRLKRYMDDQGIVQVRLHYGPNIAPQYYDIDALPVSSQEWARQPRAGIYAMGTHLLIRGEYYVTQEPTYQTDWLSRYEPVARIGYSLYLFRFDENGRLMTNPASPSDM